MNITQSFPRETMAHDYTTLFPAHMVGFYEDADNAITNCGLWPWLASYTPEEGEDRFGHPNFKRIDDAMKLFGYHSGSSYTGTMLGMQYIAKFGWESFRAKILEDKAKLEAERTEEVRKRVAAGLSPEKTPEEIAAIREFVHPRNPCTCRKQRGMLSWCGMTDLMVPPCEYAP